MKSNNAPNPRLQATRPSRSATLRAAGERLNRHVMPLRSRSAPRRCQFRGALALGVGGIGQGRGKFAPAIVVFNLGFDVALAYHSTRRAATHGRRANSFVMPSSSGSTNVALQIAPLCALLCQIHPSPAKSVSNPTVTLSRPSVNMASLAQSDNRATLPKSPPSE